MKNVGKLLTVVVFINVLINVSCQKNIHNIPEPDANIGLNNTLLPYKMAWRSKIKTDFRAPLVQSPMLYKNFVLYPVLEFYDDIEQYLLFDMETGEEVWKSDILIGQSNDFGRHIIGDKLITDGDTMIHIVDLKTGQTEWTYWIKNRSFTFGRISAIGQHIYLSAIDKTTPIRKNHLIRFHVETKTMDTIFTYLGRNDFYPSMQQPSLWVNPVGDSILLLQDRTLKLGPFRDRVNIMAINLSTRQLEWVIDDASPSGNSTVYPPVVIGDVAYFTLDWNILCIDLLNATIAWRTTVGDNSDHLFSSGIEITGEYIICNPEYNDRLVVLDRMSGEILYDYGREDVGRAGNKLMYHNGLLYKNGGETFGHVAAYDIFTGEEHWSFETYNVDALYGTYKFAIDSSRNVMVIYDRKEIHCLRLFE